MDDSMVLNALTAIPDKYVIFSEEDRDKIITLYEVIRIVVLERYCNSFSSLFVIQ
jgi:hypothetical protein